MVKTKNIVIIIQARMGSTRLPGKVLKNLVGKPMLWHIVNRLKHSELANEIVVATSVSKKDDEITSLCKKYGIDFYRGSEKDVLDRYFQAARSFRADIIVRITADCPLIDPRVLDKVISAYLKSAKTIDVATNVKRRTYPTGLDTEIFSFSALKKCWSDADKTYQREHVTIYMYEHPELFKIQGIENNKDFSHMRWTVDEKADFQFIREIYNRLYEAKKIFLMPDVVRLLNNFPELKEINKYIKQKAAK